MTGDTVIIEETATGYNATGIDHETREFRMLNDASRQNREALEAEEAALQAQIEREHRIQQKRRELAALGRQQREQAARGMVNRCAAWFAGTVGMAGMAYIEAMTWWLATVIAIVWFGVLAFELGRYTKEV